MAKIKAADPIGQALTLAARRHRARQAAMLAEIGLFPGQDQVLKALVEQDGRTMGEIAELLHIRPPTVSKMVARMSAQDLLARKGIAEDARLVAVFISDEGKRRAELLERIARKAEKEALKGLDDKDVRRLRRLLRRVARNLAVGAPTDAESPDADLDQDD
jgi:DNA-binding MarR family transcriptional regulator